jgi:hypothetical protein
MFSWKNALGPSIIGSLENLKKIISQTFSKLILQDHMKVKYCSKVTENNSYILHKKNINFPTYS